MYHLFSMYICVLSLLRAARLYRLLPYAYSFCQWSISGALWIGAPAIIWAKLRPVFAKKNQAHQILNMSVSAGLARQCLNYIHFQLLAGTLIALIVPWAMLHPCVLFSLSSSLLLWIFLECDHSPIKMMILSELHASFLLSLNPLP